MEYLIKPLSKNMFADLQKARDIEFSGNICTIDDFKGSLSGLTKRGLITTKKISLNGKQILAVFTTESGIDFLNKYDRDLKSWEIKTVFADL